VATPLQARDLMPLVQKLSHDERVRLARIALSAAAADGADSAAYDAAPPREDEFSTEEDPLCWEAEGWEEFIASR
jgi:hypothetical protein